MVWLAGCVVACGLWLALGGTAGAPRGPGGVGVGAYRPVRRHRARSASAVSVPALGPAADGTTDAARRWMLRALPLGLALAVGARVGPVGTWCVAVLAFAGVVVVERRLRWRRHRTGLRAVGAMLVDLRAELGVGRAPGAALTRAAEGGSVPLTAASRALAAGADPVAVIQRVAALPGYASLDPVARAWHLSTDRGVPLTGLVDACVDEVAEMEGVALEVAQESASARATGLLLAGMPVVLLLAAAFGGIDVVGKVAESRVVAACVAVGCTALAAGWIWVEFLAAPDRVLRSLGVATDAPAGGRAPADGGSVVAGGDRRRRLAAAAAGALLLVGPVLAGVPGFVVGAVAGGLVWVLRDRLPDPALEEARAADDMAMPFFVDIVAALTEAGLAPDAAVRHGLAVARFGPCSPARTALETSERGLSYGLGVSAALMPMLRHEPTRTLGRVLERTLSAGTALAPLLRSEAERARKHRRSRASAAARRVPVLLAGPLGLCFLPGFLLVSVVPIVAAGVAGAFTGLWM